MKIQVTQEDIDAALISYKNPGHIKVVQCPIARAVIRTVDPEAWVGSVAVGTMINRWPLPQKACQFIHDFDRGQPVAPFEFELNIHK